MSSEKGAEAFLGMTHLQQETVHAAFNWVQYGLNSTNPISIFIFNSRTVSLLTHVVPFSARVLSSSEPKVLMSSYNTTNKSITLDMQ